MILLCKNYFFFSILLILGWHDSHSQRMLYNISPQKKNYINNGLTEKRKRIMFLWRIMFGRISCLFRHYLIQTTHMNIWILFTDAISGGIAHNHKVEMEDQATSVLNNVPPDDPFKAAAKTGRIIFQIKWQSPKWILIMKCLIALSGFACFSPCENVANK